MPSRVDVTGEKFGRLVACFPTSKKSFGAIIWNCICDCGTCVEVSVNSLRCGLTKSCGCLSKVRVHGKTKTVEYRIWVDMKQRCYNTNSLDYKNYGKRKIKVCKRWKSSFINFLEDMGKRPSPELTLERINNDKGYSPRNCKWATRKEQQNNKRQRNVDITKERFGRLIAIKPTKKHSGGCVMWRCKCDCGNYTTVSVNSLRRGITKSCGCFRRDFAKSRSKKQETFEDNNDDCKEG